METETIYKYCNHRQHKIHRAFTIVLVFAIIPNSHDH